MRPSSSSKRARSSSRTVTPALRQPIDHLHGTRIASAEILVEAREIERERRESGLREIRRPFRRIVGLEKEGGSPPRSTTSRYRRHVFPSIGPTARVHLSRAKPAHAASSMTAAAAFERSESDRSRRAGRRRASGHRSTRASSGLRDCLVRRDERALSRLLRQLVTRDTPASHAAYRTTRAPSDLRVARCSSIVSREVWAYAEQTQSQRRRSEPEHRLSCPW